MTAASLCYDGHGNTNLRPELFKLYILTFLPYIIVTEAQGPTDRQTHRTFLDRYFLNIVKKVFDVLPFQRFKRRIMKFLTIIDDFLYS